MITPTQITWAAGVYEGEGNISTSGARIDLAYRKRTGTGIVVTIWQKDRWLLRRLRTIFGGNIGKRQKRRISRWQLYSTNAKAFAMTIYTFLSPRRQRQIREAGVFSRVPSRRPRTRRKY